MKKYGVMLIFVFSWLIVFGQDLTGDNLQSTEEIYEETDDIENKIINQIIFKGNKKAKKKEIDALMIIKPNMNVNLALIEQDYIRLMELNYFDDIIISTTDIKLENGEVDPDKVNLTFEFQEKPVISKIIFDGNKNIGVGFLLGDITVKNGDIVDKGVIVTDIIALEKKYSEKGFSYAKIDYEISDNDSLKEKNQVHLIFKIDEGPETFVSEIEIVGNSNFSDSVLKNKMKTKERKFFGIQKGNFQENIFYEDIDLLLSFYRDQGYVKADFLRPEINRFTIDENGIKKESIKITLTINEGNQYYFGGLEITGNKIFTTEDLTYSLKLRSGQIFNFTRFQIDLYSLNLKYRNAGYIETRIVEKAIFNDESNTISYYITIAESNRSYIESIFFRGNEKTRTYVLERAVYTKVGDILEQSNLEASRIGLMNLGFFGNVTYEIQQGSKAGLLRVIYILEEKLTADFKFGLQVTTSQIPPDVTLFGEISEKNFLGRELSMSGKLDLSIFKQGLDFKLDDPWFLDLPVSLGGTLKIYHNWTQKILRQLTTDDYMNYDGNKIVPTEEDIRSKYDEVAGTNTHYNKNYIGAEGDDKSWGNMGLHDINFEFGARAGYRFLNYFSVSGNYSLSPIYTFLPSVASLSSKEYEMKINEIDNQSYKELLYNNDGWSIKSRIGTTFSISTTRRRVNPYEGLRLSVSSAYTWGHFDSISISTYFTYYLKLIEIDFNNWIFNNVVVFNAGASFIFPGFRNLGGELNGKQTAGKGPILYPSDSLYVDGFFIGRGWGASIGTTSGYEGKLTNKTGYARFDGSIEYRVPIQEQFIWIAAFIDVVNLIEGPKRSYMLSDRNGNAVSVNGDILYGYDSTYSWMWWEQREENKFFDKNMSNWYGLENWYGSVGVGVQLTIPQLPLSFYVVKRFQVNYHGGFEWVGNQPNSPNLDFVLSMVGIYF